MAIKKRKKTNFENILSTAEYSVFNSWRYADWKKRERVLIEFISTNQVIASCQTISSYVSDAKKVVYMW